VNVIDIFV